jgi:hypothetical protein
VSAVLSSVIAYVVPGRSLPSRRRRELTPGAEISSGEVTDDGVNRVTADDDRAPPGGAESKEETEAKSDHDREAAYEEGHTSSGANRQGGRIGDQGRSTYCERDHVETSWLARMRLLDEHGDRLLGHLLH